MKRLAYYLVAFALSFSSAIYAESAKEEKDVNLEGKTPQQVYAIYSKAIHEGDVDTVMLCSSEQTETGKFSLREDCAQTLPLLKKFNPDEYHIEEKEIGEKTAKLVLRRKAIANWNCKGIIAFVKENGVWKIDQQNWHWTNVE